MVQITDEAAKRILEKLEEENLPDTGGLKLSVRPGGCDGLMYAPEMESEQDQYDEVFTKEIEVNGVKRIARVFVNGETMKKIDGSVIDYGFDKRGHNIEKTWIITNPNEKHSCGCGVSFGV